MAQKTKKSFVFNIAWQEVLMGYPSEVRLEVYDAIIEYVASGTISELKPLAKMAFSFIKNEIDYNNAKYDEIVAKRSEAGKKGMRSRYSGQDSANVTSDNKDYTCYQDATKVTNITDNVYDNVNDNNPPISPPKGGQDLNPEEDTLSEREAELNAREQELLKREAALKAKEGTKLPDISFVSDDFKDIFETWLKYKQEKRESYKSKKSLQACYKKLLTLSGNNPDTARNVVEQSMANNWSGLFGLTGNNHGTANRSNYTSKQEANAYALERLQQHKLDLEAGLADQVERPF